MFGEFIQRIVIAKPELIDWDISFTGRNVLSLHELHMPAQNHCRMCFMKSSFHCKAKVPQRCIARSKDCWGYKISSLKFEKKPL